MTQLRWVLPALAILAAIALCAYIFGDLLMLLAFAALLATGLHPVVQFLERRGFSHRAAVPLTFLGLLGVMGLLLVIVIPPLIEQASSLFSALPTYAANLPQLGHDWELLRARLTFLPSVSEVTGWLSGHADAYLRKLLSWSGRVAGLIASAATVALILFYMLSDARLFREQFLRLVPPYRREETRTLLSLLVARVGRFTLGTLTDMSMVGLLTAVGFGLIGLPDALMLGALAGLFNVLPYIGALVGSIPALLVAFGLSMHTGLMALAVILVVQQLEGSVIYPKVVGNAVGLHPLYVLIALTAGSLVWGIAGVFLGIPAAVVIKTLLEAWVVPKVEQMVPPRVRFQLPSTAVEPDIHLPPET